MSDLPPLPELIEYLGEESRPGLFDYCAENARPGPNADGVMVLRNEEDHERFRKEILDGKHQVTSSILNVWTGVTIVRWRNLPEPYEGDG